MPVIPKGARPVRCQISPRWAWRKAPLRSFGWDIFPLTVATRPNPFGKIAGRPWFVPKRRQKRAFQRLREVDRVFLDRMLQEFLD